MKTTIELIKAALKMVEALEDLDPGVWSDPVWRPKHMRMYRGFQNAVRKYLAAREKK